MSAPTLYEVLGVGSDAEQTEITRAFRKRSIETHPDKNPDNPLAVQEFIRLTKAYNVSASTEAMAPGSNLELSVCQVLEDSL